MSFFINININCFSYYDMAKTCAPNKQDPTLSYQNLSNKKRAADSEYNFGVKQGLFLSGM